MSRSYRAGSSAPECRPAKLEEILGLRYDVLISGTNRASPIFPGDDEPTTHHFGAFAGAVCAACLSMMASTHEGRPAWQLRGMATPPVWRGRGAGLALIRFVERTLVLPSGRPVVWLNSREAAVGFYEWAGFRVVSAKFEIENVGPHFRMIKEFAFARLARSAD